MIQADERRKLDELRAQVACAKHLVCVHSSLDDLCEGRYDADLDILECLEKSIAPCQFAQAAEAMLVCSCPLRQFIARNFDRWSAQDTGVVRQT